MRLSPKWGWFAAFTAVFAVCAAVVFWGTWSPEMAPVMPDCPTSYPTHWFRARLVSWLENGKFTPSEAINWIGSPYIWTEFQYAFAAFMAALGMAYFLRGRGLPRVAAYGAGLLLAFSGYWFTLFSAGHLGDITERDEREHHREDGDRLDDAERGEVVGEALVGLRLRVARGRAGAALEERGEADREAGEDARDEAGQAGAVGDLADLVEHDEHEDHPVERLCDRRADEREEEERRLLVRGIALLPRSDGRRGREPRAERAARAGEPQAGDRARDNHCCITHFVFPP